jgi:selenocysteine lyase/cysteine desulfurase
MSNPRRTPPAGPDLRPALGDRRLFPDLEARLYMNHAAVSPPSLAVRAAAERVLDDYSRLGVGAVPLYVEQRSRLKGKLAGLIGAEPGDLGLISNTTRGVTDIALCLPWKKGDRVVVFEGEFPANVTPWQRAAELFGLEIVFLSIQDYQQDVERALARLRGELERGVRLVAASVVEFQTGLRMPIAAMGALCHEHGAELFVDAIQACGSVPVDVRAEHIDYLSSGSHKWLMGLEGAGFLYVAPERVQALRPAVAGWTSHEDALRFLFEGEGHLRYDRPIKKGAELFEGGANNALGFAALEASLDLILELGVDSIYRHVGSLLEPLEAGLVQRGFESLRAPDAARRSCTLSVLPPAGISVIELKTELANRSVACSIPDGKLRFAPHWPNSAGQVPELLSAIDDSLAALRG